MSLLPRTLTPIFSLTLSLSSYALELHPTPQQLSIQGNQEISISSNAKLISTPNSDPDALSQLQTLLSSTTPNGTIQNITLTLASDPSLQTYSSSISKLPGSYKIIVEDKRILLIGTDTTGQFYAIQTLRQLLNANQNPSDLPKVTINDFPVVPFRGTVEGFYGNPWSHEKRISQLKFYGLHKLNTYIYGPKDDPFHSSQWRKPYPDTQAKQIQELATIAKQNKVNFVWAIHPGGSIRWVPEDYQNVANKFEQMYQLGVRSFAVFFDDISGEGTKPEKQADLLNWLNREFVQKKTDVTSLIVCPTEYNKSWANPKPGSYLDILGNTLHPSIHVMWTGNSVVSDLKLPDMEYINARIKRKAFIWWNFPVTDYAASRVLMGPVYGNDTTSAPLMSGFVSNPMEHAEASKITLFGVADYTWNPQKFNSTTSWNAAIHEIAPNAHEPFRIFCEHNQDTAPNGHGYRRTESTNIQPTAQTFLDSLNKENINLNTANTLTREFNLISKAPKQIRLHLKNPLLLTELEPWLSAFEQLGIAGHNTLTSLLSKNPEIAWKSYLNAYSANQKMRNFSFKLINGNQQNVTVSTLVLEPLVRKTYQAASSKILRSNPSNNPPTAITNSRSNGIEKILNPHSDEYFYSEQNQELNDWFGIKFPTPTLISNVSIIMGRNDTDGDYVYGGQLEGSSDNGKTWTPLAPTNNHRRPFFLLEKPTTLDQIRYRITTVGTPERKNFWLAIRNFSVNTSLPSPEIETNITSISKQPIQQSNTSISISPQLEIFTLQPNQFYTLHFPTALNIKNALIDFKAPNPQQWLKLETSSDQGKTWQPNTHHSTNSNTSINFTNIGKITNLRISSSSNQPIQGTSLKTLELTLSNPDLASSALSDQNLDTKTTLQTPQIIPIPPNKKTAIILAGHPDFQKIKVTLSTKQTNGRVMPPLTKLYTEIQLPPAAKFLILQSDSPNATVHEVLWK